MKTHIFLAVVITLSSVLIETAAHDDGECSHVTIIRNAYNEPFPIVQRISAAVLEGLLPVIKDIKADINNLNELYSNMNETVSNLEKTVSDLNETVVNLEEAVVEHKSQTSSELADLRALLQSHIDGHPTTDVVGNTVLLKLLPYLNNMEDELNDRIDKSANSLAADLTDIRVKVCDVNETVGDLEETVKQHKSQTSSDLQSYPSTDEIATAVLLKLLDDTEEDRERRSYIGMALDHMHTEVLSISVFEDKPFLASHDLVH